MLHSHMSERLMLRREIKSLLLVMVDNTFRAKQPDSFVCASPHQADNLSRSLTRVIFRFINTQKTSKLTVSPTDINTLFVGILVKIKFK